MTNARHDVAIIGIGCRLPGGLESPDDLVTFLRARGDGVRLVPSTRWSIEAHYDPDPKTPGKAYVKHGGFLKQDVFAFDPAPFGISPREADRLDPQQRLLLEVTWEAFEDAGISLDAVRGSDTAVFIGGFTQDHQLIAMSEANREQIDSHTSVGASMTVLSNRLSYTFDWHGASATVDTACSSSLVALHLACEEIASGRSACALAGGVNVMLTPATTIAMCKGQFLAPDGRSKSFDALADGYGRGEGAGVVLLKRLDLAERDGDRIYAVVSATGINQDGRTDGMPMPNGDAQLKLARDVLARSGLAAKDIAYVEAHGTGTRAGDPIEIRALGGAYGTDRAAPLVVGSIKSNIGHLEAAAGVTGLIKAVLSVSRREIFPLRALTQPNPAIPFAELNIELPLEPRAWPTTGRAYAAVNSFGYGGTNAHAIVAEYEPPLWANEPGTARTCSEHRWRMVPLSAACQPALRARATQLAATCSEENWGDVVHTLAHARTALAERAVVLARDVEELGVELRRLADDETSEQRVTGKAPAERKLLWVFTGMGPQRPAMGQELYEHEPAFRAAAEAADAAFRENSGWSVLAEMLEPAASSRMKANYVAQPSNFVLQVGLVALLRELGVPEHGMLGHSVGELAAAWASGCLSLKEAARLTFQRSRLQQKKAGLGGMLAVGALLGDLEPLLGEGSDLHVAAFNGPKSFTLAGPTHALERAAAWLDERSIFQRRVPVEVAYHSAELESLRPEFMAALGEVTFDAPRLPLYSTADGVRVSAPSHDAEYWWRNARAPVLLQRALEAAMADGFDAFLEVGPHPVLGPSVREVLSHLRKDGHLAYSMRRDKDEQLTIRRAVAELYANGVPLDWSRLNGEGRRTPLPSYPFQRRTHWVESKASQELRLGRPSALPLLAERDDGPSPRFSTPLARPSLAYLHDHRIEGRAVFPAAGYVDAALSACLELDAECRGCVLEEVRFERVFVLKPDANPTLVVDAPNGDFTLYGRHHGEGWERKASCRLGAATPDPAQTLAFAALEASLPIELDVARLYADLAELGLDYGPAFRRLESVRLRRDGAAGGALLARLSDVTSAETGALHPTALDAAFHALLALSTDATAPVVPIAVRRLTWWRAAGAPRWVHGVVSSRSDGSLTGELTLADDEGRVLLQARGLEFRPLNGSDAAPKHAAWLYTDEFEPLADTPSLSAELGACALYGSASPFLDRLSESLVRAGASIRRLNAANVASVEAGERLLVAFEATGGVDGGFAAVHELHTLVQALAGKSASVRLITFSAHALSAEERPDPEQAALWGFGCVVMTEQPELGLRLVDTTAAGDLSSLLAALFEPDFDEEVVVREGAVFTRRLRHAAPASAARHSTFVSAGSMLPPARGAELAADELELRTLAAAIHPADLALALRPLAVGTGSRTARGRGISARISKIGANVRGFDVGEFVHTFHDGELATRVVVPAARVVRVAPDSNPASLAACELLVAARQALVDVTRTRAGDLVVVEGAGTAAGLACVDVARSLGARVVGVVERPEQERAVLERGAERALLEGSDATKAAFLTLRTDGVRVVVSAARGLEQAALFGVLGAGGHFVSLTAPDASRLLPRAVPEGIAASSVSLARTAREEPRVYAATAEAVLAQVARGELTLPVPAAFRPKDAATAFESLSEGEPSAPLVLDLSDDSDETAALATPFRKDRSYLVTGGLAGFGLATAEWMANAGAGTLVLASRRGLPDAEASRTIARMRGAGAEVVCAELDVSDADSLAELLARVRRELAPLAGVFHAATVLADARLTELTQDALATALSAKARGAWLLHEQTRADPLAHFVLYSSVSALIGNPSQAGYAAANAFLDGLAELRRAEGLPALSVSFGAIKDTGIVARDAATRAHLASLGIRPMPTRLALAGLRDALGSGNGRMAVVDMDWDRWAASFPTTPWRRLAALLKGKDATSDATSELGAELASLEPAARHDRLVAKVRQTVGDVLHLAPESLEPSSSLRNHGLDSLMAVELQAAIEKLSGVTVPTIEILAGISVNGLVAFLLSRLETAPAAASPPALHAVSTPRELPLRERLLARICVQPPYFALDDLVVRGEWLHAKARPLAPRASDAGVVSCAEAARHLAILGSCAASLVSPIEGRVYYPVLKAIYDTATDGEAADALALPLETMFIAARCIEFDEKRSQARAETRLYDDRGRGLGTLLVDYHVIPERHFKELFAAHARPTLEGRAADPYVKWHPLPHVPREVNGRYELSLGPVDPSGCLGHFVGFPALPVSMLTRSAVDVVAAVRQARGAPSALLVTGGVVETCVFAWQHATLRVWAVDASGGCERWHAEVSGNGRVAVTFQFDVRAAQPRTSGIYLSAAAESTPKNRTA